MVEQKRGSIINNSSVVAVLGASDQISYSASKGGVLSMSRELAIQFASDGVRVNAICPGPVSTPLLEEFVAKEPIHAKRRLERIPLGRFAQPDEVANAVLFLHPTSRATSPPRRSWSTVGPRARSRGRRDGTIVLARPDLVHQQGDAQAGRSAQACRSGRIDCARASSWVDDKRKDNLP